MKILQIDAWTNPYGGWDWNNWFTIGEITKEEFEKLNSTRKVLRWLRENDYLSDASKGKVMVEDDQYNVTVMRKANRMPLIAIEYGREY